MHMLHNLLTWAIFAPFLSTGLAAPSANSTEPGIATKSAPACAASPTEFFSLPFEFWLEVVALDPLRPLDSLGYFFEEGNPVALERDLDRFIAPDGRSYAKANIRRFYETTSLFGLSVGYLGASSVTFAQIFSYSLPDVDYPGYNALGFAEFNPTTVDDYLSVSAVKVCTSSNETELRLRAARLVDVSQCTFFRPYPLSFYWGMKGSWDHSADDQIKSYKARKKFDRSWTDSANLVSAISSLSWIWGCWGRLWDQHLYQDST